MKLDTENPAGIMQPVSAAQSSDLHPLCDVAIIVLAKFPTPGKAKTRLIPAIGAESAAKVHACCLLHVVKRMQALAPAELIVCFDPPEQREPMQHMLATYGAMTLMPQIDGDLGHRIADVLTCVGARHKRMLLLAVDSPDVPKAHVISCAQATSDAQVVLGLAEDGGYWCIGCRDDVDAKQLLHSGIEWSSARTAADTIQRANALGYSTFVGQTWDDVDRGEDLLRVMRRLSRSSDADDRSLFDALKCVLPSDFS